jgi:hypothetical protein
MLTTLLHAVLAHNPPFVFADVQLDVPMNNAPPAPGLLGSLLDALFSPGGITALVSVVMAGMALVVGSSEVRRRRVALATYHAFHIVEDLDTEAPGPALDKVKTGLEAADKYMLANGWRALKPGEQEVAKMGFQSLNGLAASAAKVGAQASVMGPSMAPTPPIPPR